MKLIWKKEWQLVRGDYKVVWFTPGFAYEIMFEQDKKGVYHRVLYCGNEQLAYGGSVGALKFIAQDHFEGFLI